MGYVGYRGFKVILLKGCHRSECLREIVSKSASDSWLAQSGHIRHLARSNEFGQLGETMLTQGLPVFRRDLKAQLAAETSCSLQDFTFEQILRLLGQSELCTSAESVCFSVAATCGWLMNVPCR